MKITTFLIDMGNVVIDYSPDYFLSNFTTDLTLISELKTTIFQNEYWMKLDEGLATEDELISNVKEILSVDKHELAVKIIKTWHQYLTQNAAVDQLLIDLKAKGYRLILTSNAAKSFYQYKPQVKSFQYFDEFVISTDIKKVKPDPDFYNYILENYHLKASECFFIDDSLPNVKVASQLGIYSYWYNGNAGLLRKFLENTKLL